MQPEDRGLVSDLGPVEIDWPRAIGYYGGIGLAVAAGMIEPPLGVFIAAIPFLKMLNRPNSPLPSRILAQLLDGASKPVGGDSESSIRLRSTERANQSGLGLDMLTGPIVRETKSIWADAQRLK